MSKWKFGDAQRGIPRAVLKALLDRHQVQEQSEQTALEQPAIALGELAKAIDKQADGCRM